MCCTMFFLSRAAWWSIFSLHSSVKDKSLQGKFRMDCMLCRNIWGKSNKRACFKLKLIWLVSCGLRRYTLTVVTCQFSYHILPYRNTLQLWRSIVSITLQLCFFLLPILVVQCMLELYSIDLVSTIGSFYIAAIKGEVLGCGNTILDVHSSLLIALCQFMELNLRECDDTREVINALFR